MSFRVSVFVSGFAFALLPLATTSFARADEPAAPSMNAGERYEAGSKALADNRFGEAALFFEGAVALQSSPGTLVTAALAWEHASFPDRACDDYSRAISLGLTGDQLPLAQAKVQTLEAVLGRVDVTAPGGGWFVQLDANTEQSSPASLHASPGVHALNIRPPGKPIERRMLFLAAGEVQKLELKPSLPPDPSKPDQADNYRGTIVASSPTSAPVASEPSSGAQIRRTVGLVTIGVGVAALASGAVLGFQALGARDAYNATPTRGGFDHADSLQGWTNIAFIAGGILTLGGAALVFWPSHATESKTPPAIETKPEPPRDDAQGTARPQTQRGRLATHEAPTLVIAPTLGGAMVRGTF